MSPAQTAAPTRSAPRRGRRAPTRFQEAARAFLPAVVPLQRLAPPFDEVLEAAAELPERYHGAEASVRPWLDARFGKSDDARIAACDRLKPAEVDTLLSALGVLCHAYRWEHAAPRPAAYQATSVRLPAGLGVPWQRLSARAGLPRVGTVFHMVLNNWRQSDLVPGAPFEPADLREESVEMLYPWLRAPELEELCAFSKCSLLTEALGVDAIEACLKLARAADLRSAAELVASLEALEAAIERFSGPFRRLIRRRRVQPRTFLRLIQPTFVWGIDEGNGVPDGAAGPQLGVFQAVDAILGTRGASHLSHVALASRAYMLPRQRRLLAQLDASSARVRTLVAECGDSQARAAFNRCIAALESWRQVHRARAIQYLAEGDGGTYASSGGVITSQHEQRSETLGRLLHERIDETRAAAIPAHGGKEAQRRAREVQA